MKKKLTAKATKQWGDPHVRAATNKSSAIKSKKPTTAKAKTKSAKSK